jgi:hypothetical protein
MKTLIQFVKEYHPEIVDEYSRYLSKDTMPKIGDYVYTISPYSGYGGNHVFQVKEIVKEGDSADDGATWGDDYIVLEGVDGTYLCDPDEFWKDFKRKE